MNRHARTIRRALSEPVEGLSPHRRLAVLIWARGTSSLFSAGSGVPARSGLDPGPAWRVPLLRRARPGDLCREGEESPLEIEFLLRRSRLAAEPDPINGRHGQQGRLDGGPERGRGAAAGVLLDQGIR